jgi:hypothetical protein
VAISVAFSFVDTFPAVAVNVVEVAPAGIMTELDPVESSVLLVDSNTSMPPAGAAPFNVTVHVEDVWEFKLFGLQANWETEIIPRGAGRGLRGGLPVRRRHQKVTTQVFRRARRQCLL